MYQLIPPAPSPPPAVWAKFQPDVPNPFVLIYVSVYTGVYKNIIKSILSVFWIWPFLCKRSGLIQLQFRGWLMCKRTSTDLCNVLYSFLSLK